MLMGNMIYRQSTAFTSSICDNNGQNENSGINPFEHSYKKRSPDKMISSERTQNVETSGRSKSMKLDESKHYARKKKKTG